MVQSSRPRPFVVKLGGSLARNDGVGAWLDALKQIKIVPPTATRNRLVVVPGGGPLADAVRCLQRDIAFDNEAAHHMALLAMEQFGLALASLWPLLTRAATLAAIRRAWHMQKIPWWAPTHMVMAAAAPARSWDMTSDSLAAWLAGALKAERLLLIKSVDLDQQADVLCADLIASGVVDPLFGHFAATSGAEIFLAGPAALKNACALLAQGDVPGARIRLS